MPSPPARVAGVVASVMAAIAAGCRPGARKPNRVRTKASNMKAAMPVTSPARAALSANRKAMLARPMAVSEKIMTRLRPTRSAMRPQMGVKIV
jgi:hypothetical protein